MDDVRFPRMLRESLTASRAQGLPFPAAWTAALAAWPVTAEAWPLGWMRPRFAAAYAHEQFRTATELVGGVGDQRGTGGVHDLAVLGDQLGVEESLRCLSGDRCSRERVWGGSFCQTHRDELAAIGASLADE